MDQKQFQKDFHWMCGLEEYFRDTDLEDRWQVLHKALYHNNWYRKRDVLLDLYDINSVESLDPILLRSWINTLMMEHLDVEIKAQLVVRLISTYMNVDFLSNLCRFVDYWVEDDKLSANMPDINDFLSRGQVKSKLWMVNELKELIDGSLGNVVFYGGWYNFAARFLFDNFDVTSITSIDLEPAVVEPSKRLYPIEVEDERFMSITADVTKFDWNKKTMTSRYVEDMSVFSKDVNCVVNTSCEHMNDDWFNNLPEGTFVILQTNDYFDNPQHSNCVTSLEAAKQKYSMSEIYYEGELDTNLYNRFMLIGIK